MFFPDWFAASLIVGVYGGPIAVWCWMRWLQR